MSFEEETRKELSIMSKKIDSVLRYLHNDGGTGQLGLVADFKEHKEKMERFVSNYETDKEVKKSNLKMVSVICGVVGSLAMAGIKILIDFAAKF